MHGEACRLAAVTLAGRLLVSAYSRRRSQSAWRTGQQPTRLLRRTQQHRRRAASAYPVSRGSPKRGKSPVLDFVEAGHGDVDFGRFPAVPYAAVEKDDRFSGPSDQGRITAARRRISPEFYNEWERGCTGERLRISPIAIVNGSSPDPTNTVRT